MQRTAARRIWLGLLVLSAGEVCGQERSGQLVVGTPAAAEWTIPANPVEKVPAACRVRIPGFEINPTEAGSVVVLPGRIPGVVNAGAPDTPAVATSFKGHPNIRVIARLVRSDFEDFPDMDIAPVPTFLAGELDQPYPVPVKTYSRSAALYSADAWWPETLVLAEEAWMGTNKVVRVECRPFQYNAARKTLRFHRQIDFVLEIAP